MNFDFSKIQFWMLFFIIAVLSYAVSFGLSYIINLLDIPVTYWVFLELPGFFWIFTIFLLLFNKYFRKRPFWRWLWIIDFPNLNWNYKGFFESSYDDWQKWDVSLDIYQNATSIKVRLYFENSISESVNASFSKHIVSGTKVLSYLYVNRPKNWSEKTMHTHEWYCIFNIEWEGKLVWEYFSWRDRQNYWIIIVNKLPQR